MIMNNTGKLSGKIILLYFLVISMFHGSFIQGATNDTSDGISGNIRLDISIVYKFSNVPDASLDINIYEDFLHKVKITSFRTYTDDSGQATLYVDGKEGQWIEVIVNVRWDGNDKEGAEQHQIGSRDTIIKFTINLYRNFLAIDNAIAKSFIQGLAIFLIAIVVLVLASIQWRKKFNKQGLIK